MTVSVFFALLAILVSARLYQFEGGTKLEKDFSKLPFLKLLAFLFRDQKIVTEQTDKSLLSMFIVSTFSLATIAVFTLYLGQINLWLLFFGCFCFSLAFSFIMIRRYT
ncbi:MAG: hypothetical protein MK214_03735 [Thalassotalea sp.]|nr:hypothetical protein [Thalassotalea sp.]